MKRQTRIKDRQGSALLEFTIGLIPLMVLVVAMVQIVSLARARMEALREAREQAGMLSTLPLQSLSSPSYIRDWDLGPDERHMTADDSPILGSSGAFVSTVVGRSVASEADWDVLNGAPASALNQLRQSGDAMSTFGFVQGESEASVALLPAVRSLFYDAEQIDVRAEVWMSWTQVQP